MKRSEMEKIIAITLSKQAITAGVSGLLWVDVKEILTKIEEAGMLPPKACIERSVRVGDEERIAYYNTNEWESEDE